MGDPNVLWEFLWARSLFEVKTLERLSETELMYFFFFALKGVR